MKVHQELARTRKAERLADVLAIECKGWDPSDVALLSDCASDVRFEIAKRAGVKMPSDETWARAIEAVLRRGDVRVAS